MKVVLLAHTPNPEELVYASARQCYSELHASDIYKCASPENVEKLLAQVIASGHESVLEHASFTFAIEGISRVTSHQLVRHRLASYSQASQRYVPTAPTCMVVPDTIERALAKEKVESNSKSDEVIANAFCDYADALVKLSEVLEREGIPREDIRYFYPQGAKTDIVVTMNARELRHFFELRCCNRAQWEIRRLADMMLEICKLTAPALFKDAGAPCKRGACREIHSCRRKC